MNATVSAPQPELICTCCEKSFTSSKKLASHHAYMKNRVNRIEQALLYRERNPRPNNSGLMRALQPGERRWLSSPGSQ